MTKIAINGFGRIGRLTLRRILEHHPDLEVVAINDVMDLSGAAYLLGHDSVYGRLETEVRPKDGPYGTVGQIKVGEKTILLFGQSDPLNLPWEKLGVQVVIESTGRFVKKAQAQKHLEAGAKKVLLSANSSDADVSLVLGVNEKQYDANFHQVISNCSCTTNCAAPVLKVLDDNLGVEKAVLTTVHGVTASQSLVDGPKAALREGRAAFANIVPAGTGASEAVERVLPQLKGRVIGSAFRVPVLAGSVLEVVAQTKKETTVEQVNRAFESAAENSLRNILAFSREELVSSDIVGQPFGAIVDSLLSDVINLPQTKDKNLVKVIAWYDNEYGYASRLAALVDYLARQF